jgi:DNA-binding PadR family transcriptional regulator
MHGHGGYGGPGGFGGPGFGGPRARRGNVQAAILALLAEQPMHGYQILQELAERTGGAWSPSPGSVYPTLQMLEDQGLLTSETSGGKRVFSLTDEGRSKVAEQPEGAPWDQFTGEHGGNARQLREAIGGVAAAAIQVARTGSAEQIDTTLEILADTRKRLYRMLAEE